MTTLTARKTTLSTAIIAATFSLSAAAQPQPALEEVVVTAQKRAENLQDTAIAITAISGSTMDELNIKDSSDYEMIVPSLSVRNSPARLFLRGVGRVTNSLGTDPGVAVYLDEAYTSEFTVLNRANSLTTQRIDVLRGPQGTLFGRNTTGGAVSVTSLKPTEEFENHVRATAGDYDQLDFGASSSGPITDELGYRVYGYSNTRDGYLDNLSGDDPWDQDQWGVGAQLSWDPTDTVNVWLSYATDIRDNVRDTSANQGGYLISPYKTNLRSESDGFLFSEAFQWDRENPAVDDPYKVDMSDVLKAKDNSNNKWIAHLTWDLESVTLKYIGSYFDGKYTGSQGDVGFTSNPVNRVVEDVAQKSESYSNEIQFISATDGPLQWVGGLYYYHQDTEQPYTIRSINADYLQNTVPDDDFLNPNAVQPNLGNNWQYNQEAELKTDSYAAFAEANYSFNESWKLTAGLRYSYDEKSGYEQQYSVADPNATYSPSTGSGTDPSAFDALKPAWTAIPGFPANCCGFLITDPQEANRKVDDDWDNVSGRIVLDYMIDDESMVYGGISTGYKSGGFRLGSIQPNPSFDPEELLAYEIGYKGTFNDTLQVNAAAYFYDYDNMQVLVPRLTAENLPVEEVVNADKAEIKGFEVEAIWLATDKLTLMGNYSYIDGEYTKFCCAIDTLDNPDGAEEDLSGNPLTQAPKNKVFFNASYSITTESYGEFVPSASYSWVDDRQYDVFNRDVTKADDYYRVDAVITWYSPTDDLRVIASGRNLTDKQTWTSLARLNSFGAIAGQINEPRTWAIEVQYDF